VFWALRFPDRTSLLNVIAVVAERSMKTTSRVPHAPPRKPATSGATFVHAPTP
jgi:hypothetical protein